MASTARPTAASTFGDTDDSPPTLRTYCSAAARISSFVASGSRPRSAVMLRHMVSPSSHQQLVAGPSSQHLCSSSPTPRPWGAPPAHTFRRDLCRPGEHCGLDEQGGQRVMKAARSLDCCRRDGSWTYIMWPAS